MAFKGPDNRDPFLDVQSCKQRQEGGGLEGDLNCTAGLRVRGNGLQQLEWPSADR